MGSRTGLQTAPLDVLYRLQKEKQTVELASAEERGKASAELMQLKNEVGAIEDGGSRSKPCCGAGELPSDTGALRVVQLREQHHNIFKEGHAMRPSW